MTPTEQSLLASVESHFRATAQDRTTWANPYTDSSPPAAAYSRMTKPDKWRIVGARADAWRESLENSRLAVVDTLSEVEWSVLPSPTITRIQRLVPTAQGALPLVIAHSTLGDVEEGGVVVGLGDQVVEQIGVFPVCGCDACDRGSAALLADIDKLMLGVVTGVYRHLRSKSRLIKIVERADLRGLPRSTTADSHAIELSGASWLISLE